MISLLFWKTLSSFLLITQKFLLQLTTWTHPLFYRMTSTVVLDGLWSGNCHLTFLNVKISRLGHWNPIFSYTMDGNLLEVSEDKDLWGNYWQRIKFHPHTALVVNKANRMLGLIRHCFVNLSFTNLYTALIHLILEYDNTIWGHFYTTDITKIENIQNKATKLIPTFRHLSYEDRLRLLKLPTLQKKTQRWYDYVV